MARYTRWISLVVFCTLLVSAFSQPARALADGLAVPKVPFRQVTSPQPVNAPSAASNRAPGQAAPLNAPAATVSGSPVRLAWFYKPPTDGNLQAVQQNFHTFILTKNDEAARDALRAGGVTAPITQYLMAMAIHDPGSCTAQPWRNQVADRPGDFCTISAEHADWFLLDANGNRVVDPYGGERFYMMDPANPGWQAFWMERVRHSQEQLGWTGVFLDNVEASLAKRQKLGQIPARYPDDASYQAAIQGFLSVIYNGYFKPQGRPLQANIIAMRDSSVWFRYLDNLDGAMEEGWAVDWRSGYLSARTYEEHLSRVEQTQALGKQAILISQGARGDTNRQQFTFGSYLLVANGGASFRYTNSSLYREAWLYDNYQANLGQPLGPRYQQGGLWRRDFANGFVTVDPAAHTATITVN